MLHACFMVSQCRLYLYKNGRLDEIYESVGEEHLQCKLRTNIYCSAKNTRLEPLWNEIKNLFPSMCLTDEFDNNSNWYVLHSAYKPLHQANAWPTARHIELVVKMAKLTEKFVQDNYNEPIQWGNLQSMAKSFATVYQVYIHVHRLECQGGERVEVFYPRTVIPTHPAATHVQEKHIHMMLQYNEEDETDHCHGILKIREIVQPVTATNKVGIYGYCDYCGKVQTANSTSVAKCKLHLNDCRVSFHQKKIPLQSN